MTREKEYNRTKLQLSITGTVISFAIILYFIASGTSNYLAGFAHNITESGYLAFLIYTAVAGIVYSLIFMPLSYYSSYYIEHKYELSNQTFAGWVTENLKAAAVGSIIALPVLLLFYYIISEFPEMWWLLFASAMFLFSVILAQLVPVLIMPLFYKITPLDDDELKKRINALATKAGLKIENVYKFDMSKNTKKANAAFTGLGKTKRIILGDTLLEDFDKDQIETVIAHEMGHYAKKHIVKNLLMGTLSSFLTLWIISLLYNWSLPVFGFTRPDEIAAFPLILLWSTIIGIIQTPLTNYISRRFEYEADEYAVRITGKKEALAEALNKLTDQNLGDREPHPLVEWYSYSHPSTGKRTAFIESL